MHYKILKIELSQCWINIYWDQLSWLNWNIDVKLFTIFFFLYLFKHLNLNSWIVNIKFPIIKEIEKSDSICANSIKMFNFIYSRRIQTFIICFISNLIKSYFNFKLSFVYEDPDILLREDEKFVLHYQLFQKLYSWKILKHILRNKDLVIWFEE